MQHTAVLIMDGARMAFGAFYLFYLSCLPFLSSSFCEIALIYGQNSMARTPLEL